MKQRSALTAPLSVRIPQEIDLYFRTQGIEKSNIVNNLLQAWYENQTKNELPPDIIILQEEVDELEKAKQETQEKIQELRIKLSVAQSKAHEDQLRRQEEGLKLSRALKQSGALHDII